LGHPDAAAGVEARPRRRAALPSGRWPRSLWLSGGQGPLVRGSGYPTPRACAAPTCRRSGPPGRADLRAGLRGPHRCGLIRAGAARLLRSTLFDL